MCKHGVITVFVVLVYIEGAAIGITLVTAVFQVVGLWRLWPRLGDGTDGVLVVPQLLPLFPATEEQQE